jgi:hypothetical protein
VGSLRRIQQQVDKEIQAGDIDWIDMAQDRDRSRTFVNAVMNLRVP